MRVDESSVVREDALSQASEILEEPSRGTRRRVVILINVLTALVLGVFVATQLLTNGRLPQPGRDAVMYPSLILFSVSSAVYNVRLLLSGTEGNPRWNAISQWGSIFLVQLLGLALVHANANTATSLLLDHSLSIVMIFMTGIVINRWAAVIWGAITLVSLFVAVQNVGPEFTYALMTRGELAELAALKAANPDAYAARAAAAAAESLAPLPIALYAQVSVAITLFVIAATYFQSGMIGKVLDAMPLALDKIQIAARERQRLKEENIRMGMELDVAQRLQAMVLPRDAELAANPALEISAMQEAADEVGGDIYDVLHGEDGSTCFVIGDVTDHGLASGVVMLMSQAALRTALEATRFDLVHTLNHVNNILYKNVQERMNDQRNLTLALLRYHNGVVQLAGQHEEVIVVRAATGEIERVDTVDLGFMVGMIDDIADFTAETRFELQPGDFMLLYTDGVTEAERPDHEMFGGARLEAALLEARERPTDEIMRHLHKRIHEWIDGGEVLDDITMVLVRRRA